MYRRIKRSQTAPKNRRLFTPSQVSLNSTSYSNMKTEKLQGKKNSKKSKGYLSFLDISFKPKPNVIVESEDYIAPLTSLSRVPSLRLEKEKEFDQKRLSSRRSHKNKEIYDWGETNIFERDLLERKSKKENENENEKNSLYYGDKQYSAKERMNLSRSNLPSVPNFSSIKPKSIQSIKILNLNSNGISAITNLGVFKNLVYLDLTDNNITRISTGLTKSVNLEVLMLGKNSISKIEGLRYLENLEVLDLHNNRIKRIENLDSLKKLKILNLAANSIIKVENVSCLVSLTEINLRRNKIDSVSDISDLPIRKLYLAYNNIRKFTSIRSIFQMKKLTDLTISKNPISDYPFYKNYLIENIESLVMLDQKNIKPIPKEDKKKKKKLTESGTIPKKEIKEVTEETEIKRIIIDQDYKDINHPTYFKVVEEIVVRSIDYIKFAEIYVPSLKKFRSLKKLEFYNNNITCLKYLKLMSSAVADRLQYLEIRNNKILDTSDRIIFAYLKNYFPNLKEFNGTKIELTEDYLSTFYAFDKNFRKSKSYEPRKCTTNEKKKNIEDANTYVEKLFQNSFTIYRKMKIIDREYDKIIESIIRKRIQQDT